MASSEKDFSHVLERIPCLFNISAMKKKINSRLMFLQIKYEEELQLEEEHEGHRIGLYNLLSWVYFQMGDLEKAKHKNDEALYENPENLTALGNRAYLEWYAGTDLTKYLKHLESLKAKEDFEVRELNAKGLQAYFLLRIGGRYNLSRSIDIYKEVLKIQPNNYQWKCFLALAMRRLAVMNREDIKQDRFIFEMFNEVARKATDKHMKVIALVEIATSWEEKARENVNKVLELDGHQNAAVLRKCGMALVKIGDPQAIDYLQKADEALANTVTKHQLAKCYTSSKLANTGNRYENDLKAIRLYQDAYDLSFKDNVRPLLDLAFLYLLRKRTVEAMRQYENLVGNWTVEEPRNSPFMVARICEGWYQMLKECGRSNSRYLTTVLYSNLALFKWVTTESQRNDSFDKIINAYRMDRGDKAKNLFFLLRESNALQIAKRISRSRKLSDTAYLTQEFKSLMAQGKAGEGLVLLGLAEMSGLTGDASSILPNHLWFKAMLTEIEWQLNQGLMSCKLMFSDIFDKCYPRGEEVVDGNTSTAAEADVIILHDGLNWAPYYTQGEGKEETRESQVLATSRCRAYEDVIQNVFNLEVFTNPWLPLSDDNAPDPDVFTDLVHKFKVALVLVVVDEDTSDQFLRLIDSLLSKAIKAGGTKQGRAMRVSVVCQDEERLEANSPFLTNQPQFNPISNGFVWKDEEKSIYDLAGKDILDAYFQNDSRNVIKFFKFLAPQTSEQ